MTNAPVIGMVGLGRMGLPIASHLRDAGYRIVGTARSSAQAFAAIGEPLASPSEVARAADVVITCLPDAGALASTATEMAAAIRPGALAIELGSHPLPAKERACAVFAAAGAAFLDGEISGTPQMVAARSAPIYVAGEREPAEAMIRILASASPACHYLGGFGAATRVKLITNMLVTVHIAAAGEAVALARRLGIDPEAVVEAIAGGGGSSTQFRMRAPAMARRETPVSSGSMAQLATYFPGIEALAQEFGVDTPVFAAAAGLIRHGVGSGFADHDTAATADLIETLGATSRPEG